MNYDFAVVGANGMQGKIVAKDLLESGFSVLLCATDDYGIDHLLEYKKSEFAKIDLRNVERSKRVIKKSGASVVANCAADHLDLVVARICLELGISYVDLGSEDDMTTAQLNMSKLFAAKKIVGITGMGSTPGINNVMLRYVKPQFDTIHTVHLGFAWDSNMPVFVPPFSVDTVAWEMEEPARVLENGKWVKRLPEECPFDYTYKSIGKQKTCYTAHTEYLTFYNYLKDVGIKNIMVCASFPAHCRTPIMNLSKLGFFEWGKKEKEIEINGTVMDPYDATMEIVRRIPIPKGYTEKENIWLKVYGTKDGKEKLVEMDATAGTLPGWEEATCNVDTGMPVSITCQMIKDGRISEYGCFAPEDVVPPIPFFEELGKRKIWIYENGVKINSEEMLKTLKEKEKTKAGEKVAVKA